MTVRDVIRRDVRESIRTRIGVATLVVLLVCVAVPPVEIFYHHVLTDRSGLVTFVETIRGQLLGDGAVSPRTALSLWLGAVVAWTVPLASLLISYNAILGERQRGTIKFLLGLPNSRLAVLLGKIGARSAIVVLPVAMVLLPVATVFSPDTDALVPVLGVFIYAILLTAVFASIGVAISTVTNGGLRAVFLAIAAYAVFRVLWRVVQVGFLAYTRPPRQGFATPLPDWFFLTDRLNPIYAAEAGIAGLVDVPNFLGNPLLATVPPDSVYTADWLPPAVLVGWTLLVLGLTYARFKRLDITTI